MILQRDKSYLKDHWCQFDASMVIFLWLSVILQMFEMLGFLIKFSDYAGTTAADHDTLPPSFPQIFDAQSQNQSDFQVRELH